jgi:3' exoribonuclease, RNase T-like
MSKKNELKKTQAELNEDFESLHDYEYKISEEEECYVHDALGLGMGAALKTEEIKAKQPIKIFFDTEFIDNGKTIDLISIGMVKETGETLYLISHEFDINNCDDWLKENVISKLKYEPRYTREEIKNQIIEFVGERDVEFWAYYASYDWVAFCQLFGRMVDLPDNYSFWCRDLKQEINRLDFDISTVEKINSHNALDDAKWNMGIFKKLNI